MNGFQIQPSEEFKRLRALADEIQKKRETETDFDKQQELWHQLGEVLDALRKTPEQQYIDEMKQEEWEVENRLLADELNRRGKMTSVLAFSLEPDEDFDEAVRDYSATTDATELTFEDPVMVLADMRRLLPQQVVKVLRAMADDIEGELSDGLLVYRGSSPLRSEHHLEWWVSERVDGSLRHDWSKVNVYKRLLGR